MVGDYLANQPEITVQMRCILIDWLVEVRNNVWDWDWLLLVYLVTESPGNSPRSTVPSACYYCSLAC